MEWIGLDIWWQGVEWIGLDILWQGMEWIGLDIWWQGVEWIGLHIWWQGVEWIGLGIWWQGVEWIGLDEDMNQWWDLARTVMDFRGSLKCGEFLGELRKHWLLKDSAAWS
jgi:hypothetical protein